MKSAAITNIGTLVSGDIGQPVLEADTILIEDGKISKIGTRQEVDTQGVEMLIDANGMTVTPGLIDPHTHPLIGDWSPRQKVMGWMDATLNGGVTTTMSQGEVVVQGRPTDPMGVKALAILACKAYQNYRPSGLKHHGGAIILEKGLVEADFKEMAEHGVWLVAEVGGSGLVDIEDTREMFVWARKYGFKIPMHCGGPSIPGSSRTDAQMIIDSNPDMVAHVNGGATSARFDDILRLIDETRLPLEIIYNGNPKAAYKVVDWLRERDQLDRVFFGSDTPIGIGHIPLAIVRTIVQISSLNEIPAAQAIAMASGNTARAYGMKRGMLSEGWEADLLVMDFPHSCAADSALGAIERGDNPAIGMIMVDGELLSTRARNAPGATRGIKINGVEALAPGLHEYLFGAKSA
ncbi:MAG: amidohydrolase family protein [Chloroflexi bacterium]|nr:amidohydrolase family protein [Chloroflexota bacterium]